MQLGRQLDTRRPAANNRNVHFLLLVCTGREFEEQVQHFVMETVRLMRVIQEDAVVFDARCTEIVRRAAQRHHQGVVRNIPYRHQHFAVLVTDFSQFDGLIFTGDIGQ
ncbi:hypothetical protein SRABI106_03200 [Rahnella aquatilis]|nr:hypothetical protein SRABI106_03200 [Rahnella aquatilis]